MRWVTRAPYKEAVARFTRALATKAYFTKQRRLAARPVKALVDVSGADGLVRVLR